MTVAVTLLLGAAIVALAAPRVLRATAARAADPVTVIVGWFLAIAGVLATTVVGLLLTTFPRGAVDTPLAHLVRRPWWYAVANAPDLLVYRIAGWVAPVLLVLLAGRLAVVAVREVVRARRQVGATLEVLRVLAETDRCPAGGPPTLWLRSDRVAAFSYGGHGGAVVLTDGLRARLAEDGVAAVVAHERAHVRGRHHLLIAVAEVLARAFPAVRLLAEAPAALREQVELAADLSAVRHCGPDAVRNALMVLTGAGTPERALAMARDAVDVRLRRLAGAARTPSATARVTRCGLLGTAFAATPVLAASALLLSLSVLTAAAAALT
ncbi:Zn-dependent protease with chaperone function [Pseudonocardia sediminis]|uniref:Zn-dependent protease with chaperone function n=1 Tax=Pseudonocardia sediminis TaxID=1397368 RepID=A0A4Q7V3I8_PSEST|nr:M56 family metallopeptidase [Pseudonocardia sediminis]RZT89197.1 Zn-dependent protease with chaperone function [Pseudonocardia sediminis]